MPNIPHEQIFIDSFIEHIVTNKNDYRPERVINQNCKSHKFADVEFVTARDHWVIEAKTNVSKDAHNSVHKLFGELLKETGKPRIIEAGKTLKYGILIPDSSFYRNKFRLINQAKFNGFGELIPVERIFIFTSGTLTTITWEDFYDLPT